MSNIIRVLHVVGSLGIGGIQSYIMELYRHIDRSQVQFDFVVHIKAENSFIDEVKELGGIVYYIDGNAFEEKNWSLYTKFWRNFFREHPEYRIVHGHIRSTSAIYLHEAKKAGCYTIAHSHNTGNGYGQAAKIKDLLQYPTRYIADYCMGCSQNANKWMFGAKRANGETCIVLPNAIDVSRFAYCEETRTAVRRALSIEDNTFVIGTVGRLVEQKNQMVLIEAMAVVVTAIPDSLLIIIGDGPLKEKLNQQIQLEGLGKKIRMLGDRNDVNALLNGLDCFALPSKYEGFGISAIEAQANGLPTLISTAVPEEARITEQAVVVEDPKKWAESIIKTQQLRRKNVSEQIKSAGYDIESVAKYLKEFYQKINKIN